MGRIAESARWRLVGLVLGCATVLQSVAATELRELEVGDFHRVHFSGAGTVRLTQGNVPHLAVRGAAGVLEGLRVETREGVLYIDASDAPRDLLVELQVATLTEFVSEGDGRITGDDLDVDVLLLAGTGGGSFDLQRLEARSLEVRGHGATRFELTGQVANQVVTLSGTGAYRAAQLISDRVRVSVAGDSDVRLWAEDMLDVVVAGTARIRYVGSPRVEQRVSGLARVLRLPGIII